MLRFIARILYVLLVLLETLLGIRFLFMLVHIPSTVPVANWVYMQTNRFLIWFSGSGIPNFEILGFFIETKTLIAIAVVAIFNWALSEIVKIYEK